MIEVIIKEFLEIKLNVPVLFETPTDSSITEYVLLKKSGGGLENQIENALFTIQSYADSLYNSALLNENVKQAMRELSGIATARLNSDYEFTDTTTKKYRYQAVFEIYY